MAEIVITNENFENEVLKSTLPVILDFWAEWCGPCRMLAPVIAEISSKYAGKVKVGKVNVDEEAALADKFGISSIPTVMLIRNGSIEKTSVGYKPEDLLLSELGIK